MKIHNIRLGHACNSSSTHSLIILPPGADPVRDYDTKCCEFGWQHFTAASSTAKMSYLARQLFNNFKSTTGDEIANAIAQLWSQGSPEESLDGYIDHQSLWALPRDWRGRGWNKEFVDDLRAFLLRKDVVILGGSDQSDGDHPLLGGSGQYRDRLHDMGLWSANNVARKDKWGGFWTCYDRDTGRKVRFSFDPDAKIPEYSYAPELIDIKISSKCNSCCSFCYQDSTPEGKEIEGDLYSLASTLDDLRVFEVAIGGGEPTIHPKFVSYLEEFRHYGIVPNFTTRNLQWLSNREERERIIKACGSFAVSVCDMHDVYTVNSAMVVHGVPPRKYSLQYVLGTGDLEGVLRVASEIAADVTLLGYKRTGRGVEPKADDSNWIETFRKVHDRRWARIGIDTAIAKQYGEQFEKLGVSGMFYTKEEGAFSMYIDLVEKKWGPSSYEPDSMVAMPEMDGPNIHVTPTDLLDAFHGFHPRS